MSTHLLLRTCRPGGISRNGFIWPESGPVECPDWDPTERCGGGLHGLLWGEGPGGKLDWSDDAVWLVWAAEAITPTGDGDHKAPRGDVVYCGTRQGATEYLIANGAAGRCVHGATVAAGSYGTATAGSYGTATAGHRGTATAGDGGTATAGDGGTATAGHRGTATAGSYGTATAGSYGTATAGDGGTATAGSYGTATAGSYGTATAGYGGTATAGSYGTATAGYGGTATAGVGGAILIRWWDESRRAYRLAHAEVGEDGIEPGVAYRIEAGRFVRADGGGQ